MLCKASSEFFMGSFSKDVPLIFPNFEAVGTFDLSLFKNGNLIMALAPVHHCNTIHHFATLRRWALRSQDKLQALSGRRIFCSIISVRLQLIESKRAQSGFWTGTLLVRSEHLIVVDPNLCLINLSFKSASFKFLRLRLSSERTLLLEQ